MIFGERIKSFRVLRGWSQEDLARLAGLDRSVIARHETAKAETSIQAKTLTAYSQALGIPSGVLMGQQGNKEGLHDVFRPFSPYRGNSPNGAIDRIISDIRGGLPALAEELSLEECFLYHINQGAILSLRGPANWLLVVMQTPLLGALNTLKEPFALMGEEPVDPEIYFAFLLDPIAALDRPDLPEGLQMQLRGQGFWNTRASTIYQPPPPRTHITLDLAGDLRAEVENLIRGAFGVKVLGFDPGEKPLDFRTNLSDDVLEFLISNGYEVDDKGRLVR